MSPETYRAASDLLDQALSQAPADPEPLLRAVSNADPATQAEALRLLALHPSASEDFLANPIEQSRAAWHPEQLRAGTLLANRYRVIRLLSDGGMGEVYLVDDEELNQKVALKTLRAHLAQNQVALQRFRREVLLLREIHHPGIIRIFDFGQSGDIYFYTMKYLEGETLASRLKSQGPFSKGDTIRLAEALLDALRAIHLLGIIHRDLKPANIILTKN